MTQESGQSLRSGASVENQRQKYKKILKRIGKFQHYLNEMCHVISNHAVKAACLRDKNDELAKCLDSFTKVEEFSTTSKLSMAVAAELVATVGDHQDLAVKRVETLVVPNLSSYGRICDCIKADVWNAIQAIKREKAKRKTVNTLKRKPGDPKVKKALDSATREFERASAETSRLCQLSQEQVLKFEHKRLMDLKESLGNFIRIQIVTHTKSLELLSQTYKHIQSIDEDGDLEILKSTLQIGGTENKKSSVSLKRKKSSRSNSQLKLPNEKDYDSCSNSSISKCTSDSSHSHVVRRIESVLNARCDQVDTKKSNRKDERKSRKEKFQRDANSSRAKKDKDKRVSDSSHSSHLSSSNRRHKRKEESRKGSHKSKDSRRQHQSSSKNEHGSDTYVPSEAIKRLLSQRPSSPTRPVTAPTKISSTNLSTEDLTSRTEDISCPGRNIRSANTWNSWAKKSYYYSQSEDDRPRRFNRGNIVPTENCFPSNHDRAKRVSFELA